jgi:hypothetical protein
MRGERGLGAGERIASATPFREAARTGRNPDEPRTNANESKPGPVRPPEGDSKSPPGRVPRTDAGWPPRVPSPLVAAFAQAVLDQQAKRVRLAEGQVGIFCVASEIANVDDEPQDAAAGRRQDPSPLRLIRGGRKG